MQKTLRIIKKLDRPKIRIIREIKLTEVSLLPFSSYGIGFEYKPKTIDWTRLCKMSRNNLYHNQYSTIRTNGGGYVISSLKWFRKERRKELYGLH